MKVQEKKQAIELRKQGKSVKEIARILNLAQSSVSLWVRIVILTEEQKRALSWRSAKHLFKGRVKGTKTKRRLEMGEENWQQWQLKRVEKKKNYKKKYNAVWWAKKRKEVKQKFVQYKGGCCIYCGYNKCIAALDFHHRDPKQKDFRISKYKFSFEKAKSELDKCDLVCRNCHMEIHYKLFEEKRIKNQSPGGGM